MEIPLNLSTSCRIITISSSLERAVSFVQQTRALSGHDSDEPDSNGQVQREGSGQQESNPAETCIPWSISNKYYSADVHFLVRTIKGLAPFHLKNVPAVIFVWKKGNEYKHHIERISRDLNGSEPEVSLAVRIAADDSRDEDAVRTEEENEDEEEEEFEGSAEIDEFLASKGFEFVDVSATPSDGHQHEHEVLTDTIPSLPRVLDALSTIMWPSMQAATKRASRRNAARSSASGLDDSHLDWAHNSFDQSDSIDSFPANEEDLVVPQTRAGRLGNQARMRREMTELARWLEEDDDYHDGKRKDDPWGQASDAGITVSPTSDETHTTSLALNEDGFDDDFTVFVSAPAESAISSSDAAGLGHGAQSHTHSMSTTIDSDSFPSFASFGSSSFDEGNSFASAGETSFGSLAPPERSSGIMYHSLGSASDFGDTSSGEPSYLHQALDSDPEDGEADDGDGLPSHSEIRASALRIFGPEANAGPSSSSSVPRSSAKHEHEHGRDYEHLDEEGDDGDAHDYDLENFDLSHMVSALQGMKEEIAGMDNEDERRKAAARVALGLVYGLEKTEGRES